MYQPHQNDIGKTVVITINTADPGWIIRSMPAISGAGHNIGCPNPTPTISGPSTVCVGSTDITSFKMQLAIIGQTQKLLKPLLC